MFENSVPKPAKTNHAKWIGHKYHPIYYGTFITCLESLAHADSQALKQNEIKF